MWRWCELEGNGNESPSIRYGCGVFVEFKWSLKTPHFSFFRLKSSARVFTHVCILIKLGVHPQFLF
jgi:hypothetical protein